MSVTLRRYRNGGWEVDIIFRLPDGTRHRERSRAPTSSKSAAQRWGEDRERHLLLHGRPQPQKEVPTLEEFAPRFVDGHARANRHKPSSIYAKERIFAYYLLPALGKRRLDAITTEDVQRLKSSLDSKAPKTVNNVLSVLTTCLKHAVEWAVIERIPCSIKLLKATGRAAGFYDFEEFERLVSVAETDASALMMVLLGGEAGLRCGEMIGLEWPDINLDKRQLRVARSEWRGHVTLPKGGKERLVPLTARLARALKDGRHLRSRRVLSDARGRSWVYKNLQLLMRRLARRSNVKAGIHILRHTFCSHLAMRGAPARAIQELAGHQDLTTTQRYMHLSPAAIEGAIRLLDMGRRGDILETASQHSAISNS